MASRAELLARGRQKLQQFQQNKRSNNQTNNQTNNQVYNQADHLVNHQDNHSTNQWNTQANYSVDHSIDHIQSNNQPIYQEPDISFTPYHPNHQTHDQSNDPSINQLFSQPTPRRDLLAFLNEPSTPPSEGFRQDNQSIDHTFNQPNGTYHDPAIVQPAHDHHDQLNHSLDQLNLSAAEQAEALERSLMDFNPVNPSTNQLHDQTIDHSVYAPNPYAHDASLSNYFGGNQSINESTSWLGDKHMNGQTIDHSNTIDYSNGQPNHQFLNEPAEQFISEPDNHYAHSHHSENDSTDITLDQLEDHDDNESSNSAVHHPFHESNHTSYIQSTSGPHHESLSDYQIPSINQPSDQTYDHLTESNDPSLSTNHLSHHEAEPNYYAEQSIDQSVDQPIDQSINQLTNPDEIQYYYDDDGRIFHYNSVTGEPVYYEPDQSIDQAFNQHFDPSVNAEFDPTIHQDHSTEIPPFDPHQSIFKPDEQFDQPDYQNFEDHSITQSNNQSSNLSAITQLTHECDNLRVDNDRLHSLTRTLQQQLTDQSIHLTELKEDNIRLVQELDHTSHQPNNHAISQTMIDDCSRLFTVTSDLSELGQSINTQWDHVSNLINQSINQSSHQTDNQTSNEQSDHPSNDHSTNESLIQSVDHFSLLLRDRAHLDAQAIMLITSINQSINPSMDFAIHQSINQSINQSNNPLISPVHPSASHSTNQSTNQDALIASLQSEIADLKQTMSRQSIEQSERIDSLIKDKFMLAKRIEQSVEERSLIVDQLREQIQSLNEQNQSINQSNDQLIKERDTLMAQVMNGQGVSFEDAINVSMDELDQSIDHSIKQSNKQSNNQTVNQTNNSHRTHLTKRNLSHPQSSVTMASSPELVRAQSLPTPQKGIIASIWSYLFGGTQPIQMRERVDKRDDDKRVLIV